MWYFRGYKRLLINILRWILFLPFFSIIFSIILDLNSGEDEWRRKGPQSPPHVQTNGLPPFPPLSLNHPGSPHSFSVRQRKGKKRERDWEGWREGSRRSKRRGGTQRGTRSPRDLSLRLVLLPSKSLVLSAKYPLLRPLISSFSNFHFFSIFFFLFIQSHSIFHYQ